MSDFAYSTQNSTPENVFQSCTNLLQLIREQILKVFLGQDYVVDQVLATFLAGGHILLEGKPGLGKTHLVLALAKTFSGKFRRVQFTPDLLPSDVTGHTLYDMASQTFQVRKGPVFTNLLLADEINRAPAKTQSALLEVMQEQQVTIDGNTLKLDPPFMTLATQNPIEQEGTYTLPEAQLDRFLMKIIIDYPSQNNEELVVAAATTTAGISLEEIQAVATSEDMLIMQDHCHKIHASKEVVAYAVRIARATRQSQALSMGAGTRGAIALVKIAKANAMLQGRQYIMPDDVKQAALPVLRHRVSLSPDIMISGQLIDDVLKGLLKTIEAPR
jgi:MoxR-like ATPase